MKRRHISTKRLALYNAAEHRPLATRFWVDSRIGDLVYRSLAAVGTWLSRGRARRLRPSGQDARDIGQAGTLMYALPSHYSPMLAVVEITQPQPRSLMRSSLWRTKKAHRFIRRSGCCIQGSILALNGNATEQSKVLSTGLNALRQTEQQFLYRCTCHGWRELTRNLANSMMLGVASAKR